MGKDILMTPMKRLSFRIEQMRSSFLKGSEQAKQLSIIEDLILESYQFTELEHLKSCFEESRLTNPMVGFKHDTFEDYYNSVYGNSERNITTMDVSGLPINKSEKPPLGLKPKRFHDEERYKEVCGAMKRFYDANKEIPLEWIEEYNELTKLLF